MWHASGATATAAAPRPLISATRIRPALRRARSCKRNSGGCKPASDAADRGLAAAECRVPAPSGRVGDRLVERLFGSRGALPAAAADVDAAPAAQFPAAALQLGIGRTHRVGVDLDGAPGSRARGDLAGTGLAQDCEQQLGGALPDGQAARERSEPHGRIIQERFRRPRRATSTRDARISPSTAGRDAGRSLETRIAANVAHIIGPPQIREDG